MRGRRRVGAAGRQAACSARLALYRSLAATRRVRVLTARGGVAGHEADLAVGLCGAHVLP